MMDPLLALEKFVSAKCRNQHAGSVRSPNIGTPRQSEAATKFTPELRGLPSFQMIIGKTATAKFGAFVRLAIS